MKKNHLKNLGWNKFFHASLLKNTFNHRNNKNEGSIDISNTKNEEPTINQTVTETNYQGIQ